MTGDLTIGGVTIGGRVLTAPMTGVSDLPFRRAASRLGAAYVATEMVACELLAGGRPDVVRRAAVGDGLPLTVIQLVGRRVEWMAKGAKMAEAAGADIIDINMGCPAKDVIGGLSGSALMRDLELAERLIDATVGATTRPVTLKMRLGWDDASKNAPELAARAQALGVKAFTVHGAEHGSSSTSGRGELARSRRREGGGERAGDRERRHRRRGERARGAGPVGRGRGDDRARRLWAAVDRAGDR